MVEIILRKDIQDYEARPLFGFTYRQVATGAAIAIAAAGMGLGISSFTEINTMWLMLIMTVCAAIGLVGLGRIHDLKFEQWFAIWKADRDWPTVALFAAPTL
ncbi:PrgI family protein, partial [Eggerthella sp.]|uniref:PrgI family protein n=1 Tax=Eggerthella sp. TaxID=1929886 RepID=UPI003AB22CF2